MNFVDTHVHLHFPDFDSDRGEVISRSRDSGVRHFINIGTDLESSQKSIEIAEQHDFVYATIGIHPHDVKDAKPKDMEALRELAKHPKVVAIGEVGLDFYRNLSPEDIQRKFIVEFFNMAKAANLPLVLHIREAYEPMIALLKEHFKGSVRAVSHCFAGTREIMESLLELGLYISFAGPLTYKKNDSLREALRACPKDRILFETDAPYLAPQAHRGKRNESAYMAETARFAADLLDMSAEELGTITSRNAAAFFGRSFSR